jgi:hypothetical protein
MKSKSDSRPTPFEKFDSLLKKVIAVPKSEIDKREAEYKARRQAEKTDGRRKAA